MLCRMKKKNEVCKSIVFYSSYEGGDGTKAFEQGELRRFDDDTAGEAVSGSFSYKVSLLGE